MKNKLYIITGVNCAGKSTVLKYLKKELKDFIFYDFDQRDSLKKPIKKWFLRELTHWLKKARQNAKNGYSTVLNGCINPSEVYKRKERLNVKLCLLDVNKKEIARRLKKRLKNKKKLKVLKEILKMNAEECIEKNIEHASLLRKEIKKCRGMVINTSKNSVETTAKKLKIWLSRY